MHPPASTLFPPLPHRWGGGRCRRVSKSYLHITLAIFAVTARTDDGRTGRFQYFGTFGLGRLQFEAFQSKYRLLDPHRQHPPRLSPSPQSHHLLLPLSHIIPSKPLTTTVDYKQYVYLYLSKLRNSSQNNRERVGDV